MTHNTSPAATSQTSSGPADLKDDRTASVLAEVAAERVRQEAKWGEQNHPDGTGPDLVLNICPSPASVIETWARRRTDTEHRAGRGTYEQILTEEWAEAIACDDPTKLREELLQVAAVAVAWVEKLDREAEAMYGGSDQ